MVKTIRISMEINEQIENPMKIGSTVSLTNFPITILIGTAISVEIKPVIAAPIPAIWPTGSIAIALKFPNKNPKQKNWSEKNDRIIIRGGLTEL